MAARRLPSVRVLTRLLDLDADTGTLTWKERPAWMFHNPIYRQRMCAIWNQRYAGKPALTALNSDGYKTGAVLSVPLKAHQVVFAMHYGRWPEGEIDHRNGSPADNRPANLRDVTHAKNTRNAAVRRDNTSGTPGVSWHARQKKWHAAISDGAGGLVYLGVFTLKREAIRARRKAERKYGFDPNHGRR